MSTLARNPATQTSIAAPFPYLPAIGALVLAGLLVALFSDFFWMQWQWATRHQADWGHTLLIPAIAGYFVYRNRARLLERPFRPAWTGAALVVVGIGAYMLCAMGPPTLRHHNLLGAGVATTVFGLVLMLTGFRAMIWLWFPLLYLFVFGQTLSNRLMNIVTFKMQDIAAMGSHQIMVVIGMDVERLGNTLTIMHAGREIPLNIAEACSGMRMLMAFLALGVAMAYTGLHRHWQRVVLVIMGVPIAIFVNMLRVVTLGLLSIKDVDFAAGDFHTFIGLIWLVPAFLMFLGVMWIVKRLVIEDDRGTPDEDADAAKLPPIRFTGGARTAFIAACAILLVGGVGLRASMAALRIHLQKEAVALREEFVTIPRTLGPWRAIGADGQLDAATIETLGTKHYLDRWYGHEGDEQSRILLHVAYYTGMIDPIPHVPDRCMVAGGYQPTELTYTIELPLDRSEWRHDPDIVNRAVGEPYPFVTHTNRITGRALRVTMPVGDFGLRITPFMHPQLRGSRIYAGFFFIANGRVTASPYEVRTLAFDKTDRYSYYCKVQFTMAGDSALDEAKFAESIADLTHHLLPELMRCLPDWPAIEAAESGAAPAHDS
jgi:exosortase